MPPVIVDTREQLPYAYARSRRGTLKTGDYSLFGHENEVAIERKSKADAYGSLAGDERRRFEAEFQRLSALDYGAVVVESSLIDMSVPPEHSKMNPQSVIHSLLGWSVKYGVPVLFAGDRMAARALVFHLLRHWHRYRNGRKNRERPVRALPTNKGGLSLAAQSS